ncbi:MAG TPA: glycoside hydrolase family 3 protein, partial [Aggregatilineales bacterium]|nr:glycoside hydrolase family 3 protein [Aggregatilineales bacterium]
MYSFRGSLPPPEFVAAVRSGEAAAFCLFNYNAGTPQAVRALTEPLYAAARDGHLPPPILGIDQEGGQLMAVTGGATELPGNMALGATRSARLAVDAGRVLGRELLALGVNMNFAPSLDVNNNPANPVIGIRSFGESPALVAELGIAVMRGIESEGVIATLKHFPGHGDVQGDTHHVAPVVKHPRAYLENVEFYPFREAIDAGARAVMSSHLIFEAVDADNPATLSPAVMTGLLRGEMGFSGLTLTDAMDMYAVARFGTPGIRQALDAGNDLVLLGHIPDQLAL